MKLKQYLEKNDISDQAFAILIGCTKGAVNRYKGGANYRIPRPSIMRRIYKVTGKKVSPNDFYDL